MHNNACCVDNMHRPHAQKSGKERACGSGDMLSDRQTDRQTHRPTDRHTHHNTLLQIQGPLNAR